jgi:phosphoglucomutase
MPASPIHFGTSGWRAIIADEFTFANVRLAVTAIAGHVRKNAKKPVLIVAHDTRFFAEDFTKAAVAILQQNKIEVLQCDGPAPTPAVAFEVRRRKTSGAINFTASHNPAAYNGLKFSGPDGAPAMPEITHDIEARAAKLDPLKFRQVPGEITNENRPPKMISLPQAYLARLAELVRFEVIAKKKLKIICDVLHGCAAGYLDRALAEHGIPCDTIRANRDVLFDGTGPDVTDEISRRCERLCSTSTQRLAWPPMATPTALESSIPTEPGFRRTTFWRCSMTTSWKAEGGNSVPGEAWRLLTSLTRRPGFTDKKRFRRLSALNTSAN